MSYGVTANGFVRKPLSVILDDIEQGMVGVFGADVIQTAESPLGQLNGLEADLVAELWELAEAVYQSYDPNEATGVRLDDLAAIRLLERTDGQTDLDLRGDVTNDSADRIAIRDIESRLKNIPGVTYVKLYVNSTNTIDRYAIPPNTMVVAMSGGLREDIAQALYDVIAPRHHSSWDDTGLKNDRWIFL